nr:ribonuclease H-like domain-containing protein [Tanacetum cinerariifolium]
MKCSQFRSFRIFKIKTVSKVAEAMALYSASAKDLKRRSTKAVKTGSCKVNFFDEVVYEVLDIPYDDTNLNVQPHNESNNSFNPGSPTIHLIEGDLGHPQGSNGSVNENEMAATSDNDYALLEDDITDIPDI